MYFLLHQAWSFKEIYKVFLGIIELAKNTVSLCLKTVERSNITIEILFCHVFPPFHLFWFSYLVNLLHLFSPKRREYRGSTLAWSSTKVSNRLSFIQLLIFHFQNTYWFRNCDFVYRHFFLGFFVGACVYGLVELFICSWLGKLILLKLDQLLYLANKIFFYLDFAVKIVS